MSTAHALLDTPLAPHLDSESEAMAYAGDGEVVQDMFLPLVRKSSSDCAPCRAYLETCGTTVELTGRVERIEMPAEMKARLRRLLLADLGL